MSLSENIKQARERAGLSKSDLAKALNISVNYVYQIEGGQKRPPIKLVADISDVVDEKISVLMRDDEIVQRLRAELLEEVSASDIEVVTRFANSR